MTQTLPVDARALPGHRGPAPRYRCLIPAGQFNATSVRL